MAQRKRNIEFSKPEEPSFLKKLKGQMGIQKDLTTTETKKEKLTKQDLEYRDEEPVYVVDEASGITEKELEIFKENTKQKKEFQRDNEVLEQRIIFKKPDKTNIESEPIQNSVNRKQTNRDKLKKLNKDQVKTVKNPSLLSFNEDDDED